MDESTFNFVKKSIRVLNEIMIMTLSYWIITITSFNVDPAVRFQCGFIFIVNFGILLAGNLSYNFNKQGQNFLGKRKLAKLFNLYRQPDWNAEQIGKRTASSSSSSERERFINVEKFIKLKHKRDQEVASSIRFLWSIIDFERTRRDRLWVFFS